MARLPGLTLTQSEVSQEVDLEELFGMPLDDRPDIVEAFAQKAIEKILDRTQSGKDVNGGNLKAPYSDEYADSLQFKAAGKSKSEVNMELSGQMLGTLDVLEVSGSKFKLGWDDSVENAKAFNHNTGDTVPRREFFGLTRNDLEEIATEFTGELSREISESNETATEGLSTLRDMFGDLLDVEDF